MAEEDEDERLRPLLVPFLRVEVAEEEVNPLLLFAMVMVTSMGVCRLLSTWLLVSGEVNEACLAEREAELASVLLLAVLCGIADTMMLSGRGSMADIGIVTFNCFFFKYKNFIFRYPERACFC